MVVFDKLKKWFSGFPKLPLPYGTGTPVEMECEACKHRFEVFHGYLIDAPLGGWPRSCPKCGSDHTRVIELKMKKKNETNIT